ncbi:MAG: peptide deformylase [bacterium]|jgi:peptide deformylase
MAVLPVLTYPHPFLKTVAKSVTQFDEQLKLLVQNMFETMYEEKGIGLAATQVRENKRLLVLDVPEDDQEEDDERKKNPIVMINPEITKKSGKSMCEEGCLSVPEIRADVARADEITVEYQDIDQNAQTLDAVGLVAICVQHEIDHLNGVLFIDHLPPLKRKMVRTRLKKLSKKHA